MAFLKTLFDGNEREVARLRKTAERINALEPQIAALDDAVAPRGHVLACAAVASRTRARRLIKELV